MSASVYILECSDGSYYVGSTTDLDVRLAQHQRGEGSDCTAHRRPVSLVFSSDYASFNDALEVERQLKGWSCAKKEALIHGDFDALPALARKTLREVRVIA